MSLLEPDDNADLFAELEGMFEDLDVSDVEDFTTLETLELLTRFKEATQALIARGETLNPTTQEARDLHSSRNAMQLELKNRGVKGIGMGT